MLRMAAVGRYVNLHITTLMCSCQLCVVAIPDCILA